MHMRIHKNLLDISNRERCVYIKNVHVILSSQGKRNEREIENKKERKRKMGKKERNQSLSFSSKAIKNILVFYQFIG